MENGVFLGVRKTSRRSRKTRGKVVKTDENRLKIGENGAKTGRIDRFERFGVEIGVFGAGARVTLVDPVDLVDSGALTGQGIARWRECENGRLGRCRARR